MKRDAVHIAYATVRKAGEHRLVLDAEVEVRTPSFNVVVEAVPRNGDVELRVVNERPSAVRTLSLSRRRVQFALNTPRTDAEIHSVTVHGANGTLRLPL